MMSDCISREAAIRAAQFEIDAHSPLTDSLASWIGSARAIKNRLEKIPAVDARKIVLCKDCRYRTQTGLCGHPRLEGVLPMAYPLDFCSYGEAMEDQE